MFSPCKVGLPSSGATSISFPSLFVGEAGSEATVIGLSFIFILILSFNNRISKKVNGSH